MRGEEEIAYLGMIQGVINRMASVSATFKGLSATLFAAVIAVVIATDADNRLISVAVVGLAVALFAFFDWYYLYQEKQYRELYENVLDGQHDCDFDMSPPKYEKVTRLSSLKSFSLWAFYLPIFIMLLVFSLLACFGLI